MARPRAIVLRAPGTNCDEETVAAWQRAGAGVETWHINRLIESPTGLDQFQILTIPGGFSYGDDLGAGRILAARIGHVLGDALRRFHDRGGLVLGICNGFQVLVRGGLLAWWTTPLRRPHWRTMIPGDSRHAGCDSCLGQAVAVRVVLGTDRAARRPRRGPILTADAATSIACENDGQIVLQYADHDGRPTQDYPANPNGSPHAIAGVCDPTGRIFGLMPHPERFVDPWHHPRWTRRGGRGASEGDGLRLFKSAVESLRA